MTVSEKLPERWQDRVARTGHGFTEFEEIAPTDAAREHLLMNLRLAEGIDLQDWQSRWGIEPNHAQITALSDAGFLMQDGTKLKATPQGRLVLNAVIAELSD